MRGGERGRGKEDPSNEVGKKAGGKQGTASCRGEENQGEKAGAPVRVKGKGIVGKIEKNRDKRGRGGYQDLKKVVRHGRGKVKRGEQLVKKDKKTWKEGQRAFAWPGSRSKKTRDTGTKEETRYLSG